MEGKHDVMQDRECTVYERTRDTESTNRVRVCECRVHPVFNQLSGGSFPSYAILHAAKQDNNAATFFVPLKQNNSEGFIGAP